MPFTLTMPKLSPTMEGGVIAKWHKTEGDHVKEGDLLFEVSTDKATVEHTAIDAGFLRKILIHEGDEAKVNQAVAIFTEDAKENIEGYKPEGIQIEKATIPPTVKKEGITEKPREEKSKGVGISQPSFQPEPPLEEYEFEFAECSEISASPLAKKLAREKGVDLSTVKGSGPHHRIMSRDLDLAEEKAIVTFGPSRIPTEKPGSYEEKPISPMRKAIGERLQASKTFIPHFYLQQDVNVTPLMAIREQLKACGIKVTFNDFIIRASALALKEHPTINSGFNSVTNSIIRFKTIDISIAVSIDEGLITPILRHADAKNLSQISLQVKQLADLAKKGKLKQEQYRGGSFTISNLGMFGINDFQAIINPPQVAILAVGGIRECPVVKEGKVVPGNQMMLSLSSDHRVVDGADAAKFIKTIQKYLENPAVLLV